MATLDDLLDTPFPAAQPLRLTVFGTASSSNIDEVNGKLVILYKPRPFTSAEKEKIQKSIKFNEKVARNEEKAKAEPAVKKEKVVKTKAAPESTYVYVKPLPGQKKDTSGPMPPSYNPKEVEDGWGAWWEAQGFYKPEYIESHANIPCDDEEKTFTIVIPPPNVTGSLHLGHAEAIALEDSLARWNRMCGKRSLYNPGCDHAGIATQSVVEKKLKRESKLTKFDLGREKFIERVWEWKNTYGARIYEQLKALGGSFDWSREQFTMNPRCYQAVIEAFIRLHEKGLIFRSRKMINWSCQLNSAISEIEVDKRELKKATELSIPGYENKITFGTLTSFAYKLHGSEIGEELVVATTRIETMIGDVAVAVNPNDQRYKHLHGKYLMHPFANRLMPIIADDMVDISFGTGAVKITPAHDINDYECGLRHKLPEIVVIGFDGNMVNAGEFTGMKRFDARSAILQRLKDLGLFRAQVDNPMVVPVCSRSGDIIEPLLAPQWFVDCKEMAQKAVDVVKNGQLQFTPKSYENTWFAWMNDSRDWCISRQLWWGHRIPAYFVSIQGQEKKDSADNEAWITGHDYDEALKKASAKFGVDASLITLKQDDDVLDTWFSSGIFPISIFGWPEQTKDLLDFYPSQVLETGHDIIFFWVARMVMMCTELTGILPFKHVYLHPIIRDAHGRKMSKSLGNVIDPIDVRDGISLELLKERLRNNNLDPKEYKKAAEGLDEDFPNGIDECGIDALRFALCTFITGGRDVNLDVNRIYGYRTFCNKLWNAVKYLRLQIGDFTFVPNATANLTGKESKIDLWIHSRLAEAVNIVETSMKSYDFSSASTAIYAFWIHDFCDVYLELSKGVLSQSKDENAKRAAQDTLYTCVDFGLRLIAPFMPFLAEELFQRIPRRSNDHVVSIHVCQYPRKTSWLNQQLENEIQYVLLIIRTLRSQCRQYLSEKAQPDVFIRTGNEKNKALLHAYVSEIKTLAKTGNLSILSLDQTAPTGCTISTASETEIYVLVKGLVDFDKEIKKLVEKKQFLLQSIEQLKEEIASEGYSLVPEAVKKVKEEKLSRNLVEVASLDSGISSFVALAK